MEEFSLKEQNKRKHTPPQRMKWADATTEWPGFLWKLKPQRSFPLSAGYMHRMKKYMYTGEARNTK